MTPSTSLAARVRRALSFGGRANPEVAGLALATLVASILTAVLSRHAPALAALPLEPDAVLAGEVWRVATWIFLERSPLLLLVETVLLSWLGTELAPGFRRPTFVAAYVTLGVVVGVVTTLVALVDRDVRSESYVGLAAQVQALIVAWGLLDPSRRVRLLVVTVGGGTIAVLTMGITVALAAYHGLEHQLPALAAEALTVAFVYRRRLFPPRRRGKSSPSTPRSVAGVRVVRKGDEWVVEVEDERVSR